MKLHVLLLAPFLLLVHAEDPYTSQYPPCKEGYPGPSGAIPPHTTAITTTLPPRGSILTKYWTSSYIDCAPAGLNWVGVRDNWHFSTTIVTTYEPLVTDHVYPATVTELVVSTVTLVYLEILTDPALSTFTDSSEWTNTMTSTVTITGPQFAKDAPTATAVV
jgi:hypothetical protein